MRAEAIKTPKWLSQMQHILEGLNEGVGIADDHLRLIFANAALLQLVQYDREEIRGCTPDALFPTEDLPVIMRQHQWDLRYGHSRYEFHLPRKDGQKIPVIFSGRMITGPDGCRYHLVIVTDITEQKRVEQELRGTNSLLQERQREIEAELTLAARVQQSLVPRNVVWKDLVVEAYYSPARTIGGDFGVVLPHGKEALSIVVCDVSGHGIGSALVANRIYSETLHELECGPSPGCLLRCLHDFVLRRIATDGFYFVMAAARFSQQGRRMTFAAGGTPPSILVSRNAVRLLHAQCGILGCLQQTGPSDSADEIDLGSGDRLVFYTDGLVEVFNPNGDMLGEEGLATLILQAAKLPLPEMRQAIVNGVSAWRHGPLVDDVSLVIVQVR
jgi:PAS domain S-box-containing protein